MELDVLKPIIEAVIFAADHPVGADKLAGVIDGATKEDVTAALKELVEEYGLPSDVEAEGDAEGGGARGIYIEEVAGGFQFRTRQVHSLWIKKFFKVGAQRISKAAMETLAIVAYKQPLSRSELESIRGVDSAGVLKTLLERRLIKIVGRQDAPGRPVLYGSTKEFLEVFELKNLSGLPTLKDFEFAEEEEDEFSLIEGEVPGRGSGPASEVAPEGEREGQEGEEGTEPGKDAEEDISGADEDEKESYKEDEEPDYEGNGDEPEHKENNNDDEADNDDNEEEDDESDESEEKPNDEDDDEDDDEDEEPEPEDEEEDD